MDVGTLRTLLVAGLMGSVRAGIRGKGHPAFWLI